MKPRKVCAILNKLAYNGMDNWEHKLDEIGVGEWQDSYEAAYAGYRDPQRIDEFTALAVAEKAVRDGVVPDWVYHCCEDMDGHVGHYDPTILYNYDEKTYTLHKCIYLKSTATLLKFCPFCGERLDVA